MTSRPRRAICASASSYCTRKMKWFTPSRRVPVDIDAAFLGGADDQQSVGQLFLGGLVPGILLTLASPTAATPTPAETQ